MLEFSSSDPIIKAYLKGITRLEGQQVTHELGLKGPFQNLLDRAARKQNWTLVPELSTYSGGRRVVPDGTVRDEFRLARGWWEAKDTHDSLGVEIQKKLKAGYPTRNIIFEDTKIAVLYQDRAEAGEFALREPVKIADLLGRIGTKLSMISINTCWQNALRNSSLPTTARWIATVTNRNLHSIPISDGAVG